VARHSDRRRGGREEGATNIESGRRYVPGGGWGGPDAVGERRGKQGDNKDCVDCQRCHGADSPARRGAGREHTLAPRLPDEQRGERATGEIGPSTEAPNMNPAKANGAAAPPSPPRNPVSGLKGCLGVEEGDDTHKADRDDRDHAEGHREGPPKYPSHVGGEQVDHRCCAVPGEVRPKNAASNARHDLGSLHKWRRPRAGVGPVRFSVSAVTVRAVRQ
jgi:hypothetical protein